MNPKIKPTEVGKIFDKTISATKIAIILEIGGAL